MDPDLELSDATLQALQAFIQERQQHEDRFQKLQQQAEKEFDIGIFEENWQLSQFWVRYLCFPWSIILISLLYLDRHHRAFIFIHVFMQIHILNPWMR
jgi:hypothetical protein